MAEYFPNPALIGRTLEFNRELITELESSSHNFYVYLIECNDGSYYTGITNDLEARLWELETGVHRNSYTFTRRPVQLKYFELYHEILTAIEREKQLKGWSRKKKRGLVNGDRESLRRKFPYNPSTR